MTRLTPRLMGIAVAIEKIGAIDRDEISLMTGASRAIIADTIPRLRRRMMVKTDDDLLDAIMDGAHYADENCGITMDSTYLCKMEWPDYGPHNLKFRDD